MIKAAPRSFSISMLIVAAAIWAVIQFIYGAQLSGKDTQIGILQATIGSYQAKLNGASPDQAAGQITSLQNQLTVARKQLDTLLHPPHDLLALYQNGVQVALARNANINPSDWQCACC